MKSSFPALLFVVLVSGCGGPDAVPLKESPQGTPAAAQLTSLEQALKNKDAIAVGKALDGLPTAGDTVPLLIRGLGNENADVRETCSEALVRFAPKGNDVVLALIAALQDEDHVVRRHAATSLGEIGSAAKAAVEPLNTMERNPDEQVDVRKAATEALEKINGT